MGKIRSHQLTLRCAALVASFGTVLLDVHPSVNQLSDVVQMGEPAIARSSGGRSGGGSFRRSSPPSGGSSRRSSPERNYGGGGPVYVPPVYYPQPYGSPYGYQSSFESFLPGLLMLLILGGGGIAAILWFLPKLLGKSSNSSTNEVSNNIFTVTKIQVALVAQARQLQTDLSEISLGVDPNTPEGLQQLLQESTLALLRYPEYWTHVSAQSQVAKDALEAERLLNSISIGERSKLSAETLVNVGGRTQHTDLKTPDADEGPSAYIVVTFLVGTAHDKPLFDKITAIADLKNTLETLAGLPSDYLMTFELIWSPQDPSDSLTDDELLTEYSDLLQI